VIPLTNQIRLFRREKWGNFEGDIMLTLIRIDGVSIISPLKYPTPGVEKASQVTYGKEQG
jgi:hypothetical protein